MTGVFRLAFWAPSMLAAVSPRGAEITIEGPPRPPGKQKKQPSGSVCLVVDFSSCAWRGATELR
jgi:hypothetical protein